MPVDFRRLLDGLSASNVMVNGGVGGIPAVTQLLETMRAAADADGATFTEYDEEGGRVLAATGAMEWAAGQPVAGEFIPPEVPKIWAGRVEVLPEPLAEPLLSRGMRRMIGGRVDAGEDQVVGSVHLYYVRPWSDVDQDLVAVVNMVASAIARLYVERAGLPSAPVRGEDDRDLFLAVAGHELRTPVTVIKGYAGTLVDRWEALDERARREAIGVVAQRADELARLVDRMLSATGGASARQWLSRSVPFSIVDALRRADVELPAHLRAALRWELPDGLPPAYGDPAAVTKVLAELVTNAHRHGASSPDGLVAPIDVSAGADERSVYFRVSDAGPGIDPQNVERAFERFWQAGEAEEVGPHGVGLGLYLVRKIVERQNGWVSLRPRPGGGTVAEVRLPRVDDPLRAGSPGEA
jgi:signal transduction histidine kinase